MFLAKEIANVKALGKARSCLFGAVPGLDLLVWNEEPAQVGLVWPNLTVWMPPWHWEAMEGICLGEEPAPGPCVEGEVPVEAGAGVQAGVTASWASGDWMGRSGRCPGHSSVWG